MDMRDAPSRKKAEERREQIVAQYQHEFPEACRCLLDDADASLNNLEVPQRHHDVRTSNLAERVFVEERRRIKVIPHLQDERSLVQLVRSCFASVIGGTRSVLVCSNNNSFAANDGGVNWTNTK